MAQTIYVNRQTGEVFDAKEVSLENICDGWVNSQFISDLELLAKRMVNEDKGSITITINVAKTYDGDGAEALLLSTTSELKLPKVKLDDMKAKNINDEGTVLERGDRQSLFDNLPEIEGGNAIDAESE